jgi:hypothetical protein
MSSFPFESQVAVIGVWPTELPFLEQITLTFHTGELEHPSLQISAAREVGVCGGKKEGATEVCRKKEIDLIRALPLNGLIRAF